MHQKPPPQVKNKPHEGVMNVCLLLDLLVRAANSYLICMDLMVNFAGSGGSIFQRVCERVPEKRVGFIHRVTRVLALSAF